MAREASEEMGKLLLAVAIDDPTFGQIVRRKLHADLVTGYNADEILIASKPKWKSH
jgi:uncharacterized protein (DUF736 family)